MLKTATVRDLRYDFPKIEAWLAGGHEIAITKRGKPLARLSPETRGGNGGKLKHPDTAARRRRIWGDRVFTAAEVEAMRAFETGEP